MKKDRWTHKTAIEYIVKATYKGLTYWSASDYLKNYHSDTYSILIYMGVI